MGVACRHAAMSITFSPVASKARAHAGAFDSLKQITDIFNRACVLTAVLFLGSCADHSCASSRRLPVSSMPSKLFFTPPHNASVEPGEMATQRSKERTVGNRSSMVAETATFIRRPRNAAAKRAPARSRCERGWGPPRLDDRTRAPEPGTGLRASQFNVVRHLEIKAMQSRLKLPRHGYPGRGRGFRVLGSRPPCRARRTP